MALIMGSCTWCWLRVDTIATQECSVPICFYDNQHDDKITSPELVTFELSGPRSVMKQVASKGVSLHVNAAELQEGDNELYVLDQKIFLPPEMKLVNCTPHVIKVAKEIKQ
jgi:hypothetical protein